jgi:hypothetical protein
LKDAINIEHTEWYIIIHGRQYFDKWAREGEGKYTLYEKAIKHVIFLHMRSSRMKIQKYTISLPVFWVVT